jgi:hypothetical protein
MPPSSSGKLLPVGELHDPMDSAEDVGRARIGVVLRLETAAITATVTPTVISAIIVPARLVSSRRVGGNGRIARLGGGVAC